MRLGSLAAVLTLAMLGSGLPAHAALEDPSGFAGRPITTNAFAPTGHTLHRGEFAVGIGPIAFGISEKVQVETNLLLWVFQVYNAGLKVTLLDRHDTALALGLGAATLQLDLADDEDEEIDFQAYTSFLAYSHRLGGDTWLHANGQVAYFEAEGGWEIDDTEARGSSTGTGASLGLEHSYSHRTKFVTDVAYDSTFEGVRLGGGVLFGWQTFRLKLGLSYFTSGDGFAFPLVGFWWRFRG